jgi:hypothetical protein
MDANQILADAELWASAYLTKPNHPRKQSLILGYLMGAGISQVASIELIKTLVKKEKSCYHSITG